MLMEEFELCRPGKQGGLQAFHSRISEAWSWSLAVQSISVQALLISILIGLRVCNGVRSTSREDVAKYTARIV